MLVFRLVLLLVFLSLCGKISPVAQAQTSFSPGPFRFERPRTQQIRIPLKLHRNLLVVKATLNGAGPYNFLLDSGVGVSILTDPTLADSLGLRHGEQFRVVGAGGLESGVLAYQTDSVRVALPGVVAPHMTWLVLSADVLNLSGYVGVPIHGILGSELFRSFVTTLRPQLDYILFSRPDTYRMPKGKGWATIPLSLENNKAYFTTPVQLSDSLTLPLKLVLDTGASHALSLELDSDPRLVGPTHRLPADLGQSLTGTVRGYLGRVSMLRLGRYTLRSVLTSFPDAADVHRRIDVPRNGNIGYEILKRFTLIIDYPRQRMLLRPNASFRDPFEHDMCGIELLATGPLYRRFIVMRVVPGSPAALAGLEPDQELLSVNLVPAEGFSLTELDRILHSNDGRVLLLVLRRRDGSLHTTTVRLKRQI